MKYLKILYVQVIIGIVAGILVGWLFPSFQSNAKLISDLFISMIKMVIAPVIFFTVVLGITATVVVPSTLDTEANRKSMPQADPANWVKPEDLAGILEFVVSAKGGPLRENVLKVYNNA